MVKFVKQQQQQQKNSTWGMGDHCCTVCMFIRHNVHCTVENYAASFSVLLGL